MLVIVANSKEEIVFLLNRSKTINEFSYANVTIIEAKIKDKKIIYLITGYTSINIGFAFGYIINYYHIKEVIIVGTCASLNNEYKIGDIIISSQTLAFNINYSALNYPLTTTPNNNLSIIYANNNLIKKAVNKSKDLFINYKVGRFGSTDSFIASGNEKEFIKTTFKIDAIDLNSAFIALIANSLEIPFVSLKGISNYADNYAGEDYNNYKNLANENSNLLVYKIITT